MLTIPTPPDESRRLAALCALGVLDTEPEPELDAVTQLAADLFDVPIALISLVDAERQWFKSKVGLDIRETHRNVSFCGYTILENGPMVVLDTHRDPRFVDHALVTGEPHIRFYAAAPLTLSEGSRVGTLCVISPEPRADFAEREQRALQTLAKQVVMHLEKRRAGAEQRMTKLIADTAPDAFIAADASGDIIFWNPGAQQIFGFTAEEAIGRKLDIIVPPEHQGSHHEGMTRLGGGGTPRLVGKTIEVPAVRRDGSRIMVELTLGMWTDPMTGRPAGYASILRDVSQRVLTEKKLADQIAAIEAAHEGIALLSTDGIAHYMNRAYLDLFGLPPNAADVPWSHVTASHERGKMLGQAFPALREVGQWTGMVQGLASDGRLIDCEVSLTQKDEVVVAVVRNITEQLEERREQTRLREQLLLAQRQEAVGQLAAGLAHDFNNILAAIGGSAALVKAQGNEPVQRHADRIARAANDAAGLVAKLLEAGRRRRAYQRQDLRPIVEDVAELLQATLGRNERVETVVGIAPVMASADRSEMLQVLLNLCLNARDALGDTYQPMIRIGVTEVDPDERQSPLDVGVRPPARCAHLWVQDNGIGMDADMVGRIFEPFYSGAHKGSTGLGLAMVASIVNDAGGGIRVTSTPGKGTRFDILWPLEPVAPSGTAVIEGEEQRPFPLEGQTILLVDDEAAVTETLAGLLEQAGAEVGPCLSGYDALAALKEDPEAWSLLVTDFNMPGMTGAELAEEARRLRPHMPMILVSALPDAPRLRAQSGTLFDAVGPKSASGSELVQLVQRAIAAAKERS